MSSWTDYLGEVDELLSPGRLAALFDWVSDKALREASEGGTILGTAAVECSGDGRR
jgi:hypothetical protein